MPRHRATLILCQKLACNLCLEHLLPLQVSSALLCLLVAILTYADSWSYAAGGACGTNGGLCCPSGQCCSQYGYCGAAGNAAYCGSGCQASYGACTGKLLLGKALPCLRFLIAQCITCIEMPEVQACSILRSCMYQSSHL